MMRANMQGMRGFKGMLLKHGEKIGLGLIGLIVAWFIYASIGRDQLPNDEPERLAGLIQSASSHMQQTTWDQLDSEHKKVASTAIPRSGLMVKLDPGNFPTLPTFNKPVIKRKEARRDPVLITVADLEVRAGAGIIAHVDEKVARDREEKARIEEEKRRREEEKKREREEGSEGAPNPYGRPGYGGEGRGGGEGYGRGGGPAYGRGGGPAYGRGGEGGGLLGGGGYTGDDPNIRPIDISVPMQGYLPQGTERYDLTYWNCVVGKVPIKKQLKEYSNALHNTYNYDPGADIPVYLIYLVERKEITASGESEWQRVKPRDPDPKSNKEFPYMTSEYIQKLMWDWPEQMPPVVSDQYLDPLLTFPLPPVVGHAWGEDATHSDIPLFDPSSLQTEQMNENMPAEDEVEVPEDEDTFITGMGDDMGGYARGVGGAYGGREGGLARGGRGGMLGGRGGYGEEGGGITRGGRGGYAGRGMEGGPMMPGAYGRGGYGGGRGMGEAGYGGYGRTEETEFLLFRFFDFDVQPGKKYQYRVRLVLQDPNFGFDKRMLAPEVLERQSAIEEKNPKNLMYRVTDWSEPSSVVGVPLPGYVLTGEVEPASDRSLTSEPSAHWVVRAFDGNKAEELVIEQESVNRGSVANASISEGWVIAANRRELHKKEDYLIRTGIVMIDMAGGEKLGKSKNLTAPGQILLMDPSGRLVVRSELKDAEMVNFYHTILEEDEDRDRDRGGGEVGRGGGEVGRGGGEGGLLGPPGRGRGGR